MTEEYSNELEHDNESDISLDEEDEELIGRVFYDSINNELDDERLLISDDEQEDDLSMTEEDLAEIEDKELVERYRKLKSKKVDKDMPEEDKKRLIMSNFNDDQMDRFEAYRRTTVNKPSVKKICNGVLGHSIPQNITIVLAGLSKLFLSEIITKAFEVQERENKAKLILAIEEKKNRKRRALKKLGSGQEVDPNTIKLTYQGDYQMPLKPEHIREAIRLYKLETSSSINANWRSQGEADGKFFR